MGEKSRQFQYDVFILHEDNPPRSVLECLHFLREKFKTVSQRTYIPQQHLHRGQDTNRELNIQAENSHYVIYLYSNSTPQNNATDYIAQNIYYAQLNSRSSPCMLLLAYGISKAAVLKKCSIAQKIQDNIIEVSANFNSADNEWLKRVLITIRGGTYRTPTSPPSLYRPVDDVMNAPRCRPTDGVSNAPSLYRPTDDVMNAQLSRPTGGVMNDRRYTDIVPTPPPNEYYSTVSGFHRTESGAVVGQPSDSAENDRPSWLMEPHDDTPSTHPLASPPPNTHPKHLEFQKTLIDISSRVNEDDLESLRFLCLDLVQLVNLEDVTSALQLFDELSRIQKLRPEPEGRRLLAEMLFHAERSDLVSTLMGYNSSQFADELQTRGSQLLPFRVFLYNLCKELDNEELGTLKAAAVQKFSFEEMDRVRSSEQFFLLLEQRGVLKPKRTTTLRELVEWLHLADRSDLANMCETASQDRQLKAAVTTVRSVLDEDNMITGRPSQPAPGDGRLNATGESRLSFGRDGRLSGNDNEGFSYDAGIARGSQHSGICDESREDTSHRTTDYTRDPDKRAILHMRQELVRDMDVMAIVRDMRAQGTLSASDEERVMVGRSREEQSSRMVTVLLGRGSGVLDDFVVSLKEMNIRLAEALQNERQQQQQRAVEIVQVPSESVEENSLDDISELPTYKMSAVPKGLCILINNTIFTKVPHDPTSKDMPPRTGSNMDRANLEWIFDSLGFNVEIHNDLDAREMSVVLSDVARVDHTHYDCFICCILTHGASDQLYGSDGRLIQIRDLTQHFKGQMCPSLRGKPKLFFIQACRGKERQLDHDLERDAPLEVVEVEMRCGETIPNEADFLMGYATVPGFVSYRSKTSGSWYIKTLTQMLEKYARKEDLLSILVKVNQEVSRDTANYNGGAFKQIPAPLVTLRKKLYFY